MHLSEIIKAEEIERLNKENNLLINQEKKLTRGTKKYIQDAINDTNTTDRYVLCEIVAQRLENTFKGKTLDYQLKRMDLETTKKILEAIDTYIFDQNYKFYNVQNKTV